MTDTELLAATEVTMSCPACTGAGDRFRPAAQVGADIGDTQRWHDGRDDVPLKLMHREAVPIDRCRRCGTLWRADPELWSDAVRSYVEDRYDPTTLPAMHDAERREAYRDRHWLVHRGVVPGARLLEVASYVGGLLAFAADEGAAMSGIDPNPQLVSWCTDLGFAVRPGTLDQVSCEPRSLDGVWILNCFDQVPNPHELLGCARSLLRTTGRIVLRTPNALFLHAAYAPHAPPSLRAAAQRDALWGVPHLACYTPAALATMLTRHGFVVESVRARPGCGTGAGPTWFDMTAVARRSSRGPRGRR